MYITNQTPLSQTFRITKCYYNSRKWRNAFKSKKCLSYDIKYVKIFVDIDLILKTCREWLTLWSQVSFLHAGFAFTWHSKYTSSPSLMSSGFSVLPSIRETIGGTGRKSAHILNTSYTTIQILLWTSTIFAKWMRNVSNEKSSNRGSLCTENSI